MDWASGYVTDIEYGAHYFSEMDPARLPLAFINAGYEPPQIRTVCELGYGMGVALNVHAALHPEIDWYGTDFNPSHAVFANRLARDADLTIQAVDDSFEAFFAREDLPDFDMIAMHGIWSWVSQENRDRIVAFIRRKLRVGGVVYVSYNALPGWSPLVPLRNLLIESGSRLSAPAADSATKVEEALNLARRLFDTQPAFAQVNPTVGEKLAVLAKQPKAYLAHEYMNRDWKPMHFGEVSEALSQAKLQFLSSAGFLELVDDIWLTPEQKALIDEAPSVAMEQTLRDYMVNQQFRRDLWIKGGTPLSLRQRVEAMKSQRVALVKPVAEVPLRLNLGPRQVDLQPSVYRPILDALDALDGPTIGEVAADVEAGGLNLMQVIEAIVVLIGAGAVAPARETTPEARAATARLNSAILNRVVGDPSLTKLISPTTGLFQDMDLVVCLMVKAWRGGVRTVEGLVEASWDDLSVDNRRLVRDGQTLNSREENLNELHRKAEQFYSGMAPILVKLGVLSDEDSSQCGRESANATR